MGCFQRIATVAFLGIFFSRAVWGRTLHLTSLNGRLSTNQTLNENGEPTAAVDLSDLLECKDFQKVQTIEVQLERGGPRYSFHLQPKTSKKDSFVGLTRDHRARVSFLRYKVKSLGLIRVTGVIQDSDAGYWYEIKPNVKGISLVTAVADSEFAPFDPILPSRSLQMQPNAASEESDFQDTEAPGRIYSSISSILQEARKLVEPYLPISSAEGNEGFDTIATDEVTFIDIMVVWTYQAECIKSHLPADCAVSSITRQNMKMSIHFFLRETNTAFANSGLRLELRLAHGQRAVYSESTFNQALDDLQEGHVPFVKQRREKYKADLVMMLMDRTADYPETGIAYNNYENVQADVMYSVVAAQYTSVWYLPAHELGHNFGCSHDRGTVDMCHDNSKTSYGYRDPQGGYRDIMSYPIPTRMCNNLRGKGFPYQTQPTPIIPYFSNNRKEGRYDGASLGGPENNCAAQIQRVQHKIANLY